jgi:hypothetical protein
MKSMILLEIHRKQKLIAERRNCLVLKKHDLEKQDLNYLEKPKKLYKISRRIGLMNYALEQLKKQL